MAQHQAFRRVAVPAQVAQKLEVVTLPAPTRGLVISENEAYMQPGACVLLENWKPTLRGLALRAGYIEYCVLPETTPIISAFEYASGNDRNMFAGNATKLYDVTTNTPVLVKSGQTSGNYASAQMANAAGDHLIVVNDTGDLPLMFDGSTWVTYSASEIFADPVDYPGATVAAGANLTYVCKYRNRLFFVEGNSMNAWYLGINSIAGALEMIPLSGAATQGGKLLFCASWSIDAGDGIDDKLVFCTDLGELIIFSGSNPADPNNWRQEGRYQIGQPLGMNAHISIGGDLLIATLEGITPTSGAITKSRAELELAAITRNIRSLWRFEAIDQRAWDWTMHAWDEYGGLFVTVPGKDPGERYCLVANTATGAWTKFTNWDATCWVKMRGDMFFGTQDGVLMQADRTGYDNGAPYIARMVGGWEMFSSPSQTITWRQARLSFSARAGEPFQPQVSAATDYVITLPTPPAAGPDPGLLDVWDQGLWDTALWDAAAPSTPTIRNTGWVSVGMTGYSHAPTVQVTVAQQAPPEVELISIAAAFERAGINV